MPRIEDHALIERRQAAALVQARASRIDAWLAEIGAPVYGREAACFFWLLEAVEEMAPLADWER